MRLDWWELLLIGMGGGVVVAFLPDGIMAAQWRLERRRTLRRAKRLRKAAGARS